jgi:hypothetical protein
MASFKLEITADTVAWYAAIVATLSVFLSILKFWRDRAKIKITLSKNMSMYPSEFGDENKTFMVVDIANIGQRPITITKVGFETTTDKDILLADSLKKGARELNEGKSTSYLTDESQISFEKLTTIIVFDATGKKYKRKVSKAIK